jgi:hypothetical protein
MTSYWYLIDCRIRSWLIPSRGPRGTIARYLNTLCIVQDDDEMIHSQFNDMASTNANSKSTIVAKDGEDSNHGLKGYGRCHVVKRLGKHNTVLHNP